MVKTPFLTGVLVATIAAPATAEQLEGPARFCGFSPIIDLLPGEKITTLQGGIHGGRFRWDGAFGSLEVAGIGWASRPRGRIITEQSDTNPARFEQRLTNGRYEIAIWNGGNGAAYFSSESRLTTPQIDAIDRVRLFEEGQEPADCDLRTVFSRE